MPVLYPMIELMPVAVLQNENHAGQQKRNHVFAAQQRVVDLVARVLLLGCAARAVSSISANSSRPVREFASAAAPRRPVALCPRRKSQRGDSVTKQAAQHKQHARRQRNPEDAAATPGP